MSSIVKITPTWKVLSTFSRNLNFPPAKITTFRSTVRWRARDQGTGATSREKWVISANDWLTNPMGGHVGLVNQSFALITHLSRKVAPVTRGRVALAQNICKYHLDRNVLCYMFDQYTVLVLDYACKLLDLTPWRCFGPLDPDACCQCWKNVKWK